MKSDVDLSMKSGQDLFQVSMMFEERVPAPSILSREVGKYQGKFYLINYMANRIERLTLGAYRHLSNVWKSERRFCTHVQKFA